LRVVRRPDAPLRGRTSPATVSPDSLNRPTPALAARAEPESCVMIVVPSFLPKKSETTIVAAAFIGLIFANGKIDENWHGYRVAYRFSCFLHSLSSRYSPHRPN
jgi:hypothetical protein